MNESKYLEFIFVRDTGKTKAYNVISRNGGALLATISWYSPWRQYVMFPIRLTVWNPECLSTIIEFIEGLMAERTAKAGGQGDESVKRSSMACTSGYGR